MTTSTGLIVNGSADAAYARALLDIAAEVEAAEARIKAELLRAAAAGDCQRVADIVLRWMKSPATEVLADGEQRS